MNAYLDALKTLKTHSKEKEKRERVENENGSAE